MRLRLVEPTVVPPEQEDTTPTTSPVQPIDLACLINLAMGAMGHAQAACAAYLADPGPNSERAVRRALWAAGMRVGMAEVEVAYVQAERAALGERTSRGDTA